MPVFWFALSFAKVINWWDAALIFFILHLLVYPSSNGYNSYMDRDEGSIGGIKNPLQPTVQLLAVTYLLDALAVLLSLVISGWFALGVFFYIVCSRMYSSRAIRLKKYPVIGFLTVILNQGSLTFLLVTYGANAVADFQISWLGLTAAAFLIGGFYPITQVYQHDADRRDGVTTLSMLLGVRGTFIFCALMYLIALSILWVYFVQVNEMRRFIVLQVYFLPVLAYFLVWFAKVWKHEASADFSHTMQMNWLASTCTSAAFITIIILQIW